MCLHLPEMQKRPAIMLAVLSKTLFLILTFSDISFGANLETVLVSQDLNESPVGNQLYYIVDNLHTASVQHNVHLGLYSLED